MTNKKTKQKTSRFFLGLGLGISLVTINALANTPLVDKNGCDQALEVASETNEVALPKLPLYAIGIEMAKAKGDLITLLSNLHQRAGTTFTAMAPLNLKAVVVTADPDAIRAILRDTDKTTESKFSKDPLQVKPLQKFGGKNTLVSAPYEIWKPQRQKLAPAFTPKEIGNADYSAQIGKIVDSHIFAVKAGELNYQKWIKRTSLDAILKLLFGYEAPASQLDLLTSDNINVFDKRLIAETLNPFPVQLHELPNVTGFQRQLKAANQAVQSLAEDVMKHMEANSDSSKGFMSLLMGLKGPDGAALTREEIKNQIRLFIFAGHDTTAHTLTWAFEEIFSNSAIKEKLESLIQAGDKEKTLEYVDEIWNEALRLHMPITFLQRMAKEDVLVQFGGKNVRINKGTTVVLDTMSMQRSESLWGRERTGFAANEFHPERFSPENLALFHLTSKDLETFAFGSGPRVCIGAYLARAEAREMILKFFGSFHTGVLDGGIAMSPTNQALISPIKIPVY